MHEEARKKVSVARYALVRKRPYLSTVIWAMKPIEQEGLGTIGVDKHANMYYDPVQVMEWDMDQLVTVLYHESHHILRAHPDRRDERDPKLWNLAVDCEINDDIIEETQDWHDPADWNFPGDPCLPSKFKLADGKMAEEYYNQLMKDPELNKQKGGNQPGDGRCGGAAGNDEGHETAGQQEGGEGQTLEPHQMEALKSKVANDIKEHEATIGSVPGALSRWAKERLEGKVDWRKKLAALARRAITIKQGKNDYTYRRPSRRDLPGIILPSTVSPDVTAAVIIDTSGSMSSEMLEQATTEVEKIMTSAGIRNLKLIASDTQEGEIQKIKRVSDINLKGGGGTDMRIPMAQVEKMTPKPAVCIVMTDCATPWPTEPLKGISTIVCNVSRYNSSYYYNKIPKFFHKVTCEEIE